ncbi:MAG: 5-formyltetrahydrofolate cyclo-ligase [Pyrinomonadaceae bacterium]
MTKSELRKVYLERRRSLSPLDHSALSSEIVDRLFAAINVSSIHALHCYISLEHFGEVETGILFSRVWAMYPRIIATAPRIDDATRETDSLIYQHDTPTLENRWKIPEPAGSEIVSPEALDLVIVPLLCFDRGGHRVGYGKGFYDRFLQKCRPDCIKAGLSFFPPVDSIDDIHESDVPLDLCVTPAETFQFR